MDTEADARRLLVAACDTNLEHEFIAKELVRDQTLANLRAFGDRLHEMARRLGMAHEE